MNNFFKLHESIRIIFLKRKIIKFINAPFICIYIYIVNIYIKNCLPPSGDDNSVLRWLPLFSSTTNHLGPRIWIVFIRYHTNSRTEKNLSKLYLINYLKKNSGHFTSHKSGFIKDEKLPWLEDAFVKTFYRSATFN